MMDKGWSEALALMQRALAMLDDTKAPAEVGAHLDLAIVRLAEHIAATAAQIPRHQSRLTRSN